MPRDAMEVLSRTKVRLQILIRQSRLPDILLKEGIDLDALSLMPGMHFGAHLFPFAYCP